MNNCSYFILCKWFFWKFVKRGTTLLFDWMWMSLLRPLRWLQSLLLYFYSICHFRSTYFPTNWSSLLLGPLAKRVVLRATHQREREREREEIKTQLILRLRLEASLISQELLLKLFTFFNHCSSLAEEWPNKVIVKVWAREKFELEHCCILVWYIFKNNNNNNNRKVRE